MESVLAFPKNKRKTINEEIIAEAMSSAKASVLRFVQNDRPKDNINKNRLWTEKNF